MKRRAPSAVIVWPTRPGGETPSVVILRQMPVRTSWAHRSLNDALVVLPPNTYIVSPTAHAQCPDRFAGTSAAPGGGGGGASSHSPLATLNQWTSLKHRPGALPPNTRT